MNKRKFDIVHWEDGELALRHCAWHQPIDDPQVKKDIEALTHSFKIKYVTSGICAECLAIVDPDNHK